MCAVYYNTLLRLQNNLAELHALLTFIQPDVFTDADAFVAYFTPPVKKGKGKAGSSSAPTATTRNTEQLHALLLPLMLRRTIADVKLKLPPLTETVVHCPMSAMQKQW